MLRYFVNGQEARVIAFFVDADTCGVACGVCGRSEMTAFVASPFISEGSRVLVFDQRICAL